MTIITIPNDVGNKNPLEFWAPILEVFSTFEIGTMIRVVLFVVKRRLACVELLNAAD
ncbi:MAG: hypothetical protein WCI87_07910 [Euryarchaeota archaeon]